MLSGFSSYLPEDLLTAWDNLEFLIRILMAALLGLMIGAYVGAKFTRHAPRWFLKWMMVLLPGAAGALMIFFNI